MVFRLEEVSPLSITPGFELAFWIIFFIDVCPGRAWNWAGAFTVSSGEYSPVHRSEKGQAAG